MKRMLKVEFLVEFSGLFGMSLIHNEVLYRPKWVHGSILSLDYN